MKIVYVFLFLGCILLFSCKKQLLSPTQGQLVAQNLESTLGIAPNVEQDYSVHVLDQSTGNAIFSASRLSISENGFIVLFNFSGATTYRVTYNLAVLKSYEIDGHSLYLFY